MDSVKVSCSKCKYAYLKDHGYSNWTVEGTDVTCLKGVHPSGTFDHFYGEAPELRYAEKCALFIYGKPIQMDVDRENEEYLDPEERLLLKEFEAVKLLIRQ